MARISIEAISNIVLKGFLYLVGFQYSRTMENLWNSPILQCGLWVKWVIVKHRIIRTY